MKHAIICTCQHGADIDKEPTFSSNHWRSKFESNNIPIHELCCGFSSSNKSVISSTAAMAKWIKSIIQVKFFFCEACSWNEHAAIDDVRSLTQRNDPELPRIIDNSRSHPLVFYRRHHLKIFSVKKPFRPAENVVRKALLRPSYPALHSADRMFAWLSSILACDWNSEFLLVNWRFLTAQLNLPLPVSFLGGREKRRSLKFLHIHARVFEEERNKLIFCFQKY